LTPQSVKVVRITTRGCCGHQPLQDLEIRVGNSSTDLQRNPLCAWYPGTLDEGTTKEFTCARPLIGQFVAIQLVGVEGSLSLCEVEVFSNDGKCFAILKNIDLISQYLFDLQNFPPKDVPLPALMPIQCSRLLLEPVMNFMCPAEKTLIVPATFVGHMVEI
jgi:hypothetical protein